ncbi:hypothetical protein BDV37DRAFT_265060 [Aspergillus pseudonomiae]|uniref:Cellobiose dehydrogenase cytochrome domain-containing protein n=1 Tax=Aspergillus pseudonomiae TaxID=1506151 RepID=A0A5N7CU39_9EURO|nr:uncharacterized protein BDV37DRAFT_265060 [Aspergillus pseudonomiae]KAE8397695.1 hypothetical protein BDV37DRAFT_265060 [Aspergillus pseudonomiae]
MRFHFAVKLCAAALESASMTLGQRPTTFSPVGQDEVFFSIAIPDTTAHSGSGPIFFQVKAPSTLQWVGLGQGSQMAGANMFILHSTSSTNVALSPRSGEGHFPPVYNPDSRISLLEGSGIQDGTMTANALCENCNEWQGGSMDPSSSSTQWIYAYKEGPPLNSDSATVTIQRHDGRGGATVDLSRAMTSSDNPFLEYDPAVDSSNVTGFPGVSPGTSMLIAHGVIMAIAFVLLFPSFALLVPLPWPLSITKVHAPLQILALALAVAGMGVGIRLVIDKKLIMSAHPVIGIIVMALLVLFQPMLGFLQHRHFHRSGEKGIFAYIHRWLGRSMMILGIVNGGLGFRLAGVGNPSTPRGAMIAYSVIAGVVGSAYIGVLLLAAVRGGARRQERRVLKHEPRGHAGM